MRVIKDAAQPHDILVPLHEVKDLSKDAILCDRLVDRPLDIMTWLFHKDPLNPKRPDTHPDEAVGLDIATISA